VIIDGVHMWMRLSWLQRRMFLRAAVWLGITDVALRTIGLQRIMRMVPSVAATLSAPYGHVGLYAWILDFVGSHYPVPAHCLHKSLVLHFWLRKEGIPSELRIGVRKEDRQLKAHAWVEIDGQVVNDSPDAVSAFRPLSSVHTEGLTWPLELLSIAPRAIRFNEVQV
jgi:transglutaminase superfamily protein